MKHDTDLPTCIPASLMAPMLKNLPAVQEAWVPPLGWGDPLEKAKATHSRILAQRIPWTEEPGGLQSTGSQRVGDTAEPLGSQASHMYLFDLDSCCCYYRPHVTGVTSPR